MLVYSCPRIVQNRSEYAFNLGGVYLKWRKYFLKGRIFKQTQRRKCKDFSNKTNIGHVSHNAYISMDGYLDICFRRSVLRAATTTLQHAGCVGNMLTLWLNGPVSDYLMSGRFGVHFWRRWDVGFLFQFRGHQMIHVLILSRTPSLTTRRVWPHADTGRL